MRVCVDIVEMQDLYYTSSLAALPACRERLGCPLRRLDTLTCTLAHGLEEGAATFGTETLRSTCAFPAPHLPSTAALTFARRRVTRHVNTVHSGAAIVVSFTQPCR